jgi:hypothetical protein
MPRANAIHAIRAVVVVTGTKAIKRNLSLKHGPVRRFNQTARYFAYTEALVPTNRNRNSIIRAIRHALNKAIALWYTELGYFVRARPSPLTAT